MWLVAPSLGQSGTSAFRGSVYRTRGPGFDRVPFTPLNFPNDYTAAGELMLNFDDENSGTMTFLSYSFVPYQTKAIKRFIFASGGTNCMVGGPKGASPGYQGLWISPTEAGWGVNLTHQGDILFATWLTYPSSGGFGQWLVMSRGAKTASGTYSGELQRTAGPPPMLSRDPAGIMFDPALVTRSTVGATTFTFSDADHGIFAYTVDGVSQSKAITRFLFSAPATACQ